MAAPYRQEKQFWAWPVAAGLSVLTWMPNLSCACSLVSFERSSIARLSAMVFIYINVIGWHLRQRCHSNTSGDPAAVRYRLLLSA